MSHYFSAFCTNGHKISDLLETPHYAYKCCEKCGKQIITTCPSCNEPIRGRVKSDFLLVAPEATVPAYCRKCGAPYPWTESALEAMELVLKEDDRCTDVEKAGLIEVLPDLLDDTPKTKLAALRFQKFTGKCGTFVAESLRDLIVQVGSAAALKLLGLG